MKNKHSSIPSMHTKKNMVFKVVAAIICLGAIGCTKNMEIRTVPTTTQAVKELRSGRADAVVGDFPVIAFEARESAGAVVAVSQQFEIETLGIGVSKEAPELKTAMTDALRRIMEDKSYLNLLVSWAVSQGKLDPPPQPASVPATDAVPQLSDGELKVGMELSYAPMEFFDEFKKEAGVDVELGRALGRALGVDVAFVDMPFDALIGAVETGKVDVVLSAMAITEERSQRIDFVPYLAIGSGILVNRGNPLKIRKLKNLCGKIVAVQNATSQLTSLQNLVCE